MTEIEIMQALTFCADEDIEKCRACPLFSDGDCYIELAKNVLLLIEKKNKEIEKLKER